MLCSGEYAYDRLELRRIFGRTVIRRPRASNGELGKANHVHHTDRRQCRAKQIGTLVQDRADQQTAVRTALDRELSSVTYIYWRSAIRLAPMKSSKTFCFFSFVPASCQASPYSAAAANIDHRVNAAHLQPGEPRNRKSRGLRNIKAAIAVKRSSGWCRRACSPFLWTMNIGNVRAVLALE